MECVNYLVSIGLKINVVEDLIKHDHDHLLKWWLEQGYECPIDVCDQVLDLNLKMDKDNYLIMLHQKGYKPSSEAINRFVNRFCEKCEDHKCIRYLVEQGLLLGDEVTWDPSVATEAVGEDLTETEVWENLIEVGERT